MNENLESYKYEFLGELNIVEELKWLDPKDLDPMIKEGKKTPGNIYFNK